MPACNRVCIDALSGGRLNLGLGVSHKLAVEGWHDQTIDKPVTEMREYVAIVRAILAGDEPPAGEKWKTRFRLFGLEPPTTSRTYACEQSQSTTPSAISPASRSIRGDSAAR